jgi:hypothetical protein
MKKSAMTRAAAFGVGLAALLVASPIAAQMPVADTTASSVILAQYRGAEAARFASTTRWVVGGFAGGLTLGPVGAGLAWTLARSSDAELPADRLRLLLQEEDAAYVEAYQRSYAQTLHERRRKAALKGGIIGTAALAVTATAIWAVYYYY